MEFASAFERAYQLWRDGLRCGRVPDDGASLTPLEVRLERNKCISNLSLDFFERLYDRRPIWERYVAGHVNLHVHGSIDGMRCCAWVAANLTQVIFKTSEDPSSDVTSARHEMPVFIRIGTLAEQPRPIASLVRLQSLDYCDMAGVDAFEATSLCVPNKVLFRVHNRKLRAALLGAGIEYGQFENKIIESTSEVVTNLPHQNAELHSVESLSGKREIRDALVRGIRIELKDNGIGLFSKGVVGLRHEIKKVFVCPLYSFETAIERVREVIDHATLSLQSAADRRIRPCDENRASDSTLAAALTRRELRYRPGHHPRPNRLNF